MKAEGGCCTPGWGFLSEQTLKQVQKSELYSLTEKATSLVWDISQAASKL